MDIEIELPIKRMTYEEAMNRYGSDKPDTRFGMELVNVSDVVKNSGFGVFVNAVADGGAVRGINVKGQGDMSRKKIDKLVDLSKEFGAKGLAYLAITEDGNYKSSFAKFMTEDELKALVDGMSGQAGDLLLFVADENTVSCEVLGGLRLEIGRASCRERV